MSPRLQTRHRFGNQKLESAHITYLRSDDNVVTTRIGYGATLALAVTDADNQLRPGEWKRLVVSTVRSVAYDVSNPGGRKQGNVGGLKFEGTIVYVPEPQVRAHPGKRLTDE